MENIVPGAVPLAAPYEYAVAGRGLAGERHSGDAALVCPIDNGLLVAVIDGLGHGDEAAVAAKVAISTLRQHAGQPVATLLKHCHEALRPTRGVAMALAVLEISSQSMVWSGVGNVEGVLIAAGHRRPRYRQYLTSRGGVVGYHLPGVRVSVVPIAPGDLLILATDGIDDGFALDDFPNGAPRRMARSILDSHGKATDDALVLVLRWLGRDAGPITGGAHER